MVCMVVLVGGTHAQFLELIEFRCIILEKLKPLYLIFLTLALAAINAVKNAETHTQTKWPNLHSAAFGMARTLRHAQCRTAMDHSTQRTPSFERFAHAKRVRQPSRSAIQRGCCVCRTHMRGRANGAITQRGCCVCHTHIHVASCQYSHHKVPMQPSHNSPTQCTPCLHTCGVPVQPSRCPHGVLHPAACTALAQHARHTRRIPVGAGGDGRSNVVVDGLVCVLEAVLATASLEKCGTEGRGHKALEHECEHDVRSAGHEDQEARIAVREVHKLQGGLVSLRRGE